MSEHKHKALIAEAVHDMNRQIEGSYKGSKFQNVGLELVINPTSSEWIFRFADEVPAKQVVTSSLTDDEFWSIANKQAGNGTTMTFWKDIANAAHARAMQDADKVIKNLEQQYDELLKSYEESVKETGEAMDAVERMQQSKNKSSWNNVERRKTKPTPASEPQNDFDINVSGRTVSETEPQTVTDNQRIMSVSGIERIVKMQSVTEDWLAIAKEQDVLTRQKVIAEIMALPAVTGLSAIQLNSFTRNGKTQDQYLFDFANSIIAHFLASIPELLKEPK